MESFSPKNASDKELEDIIRMAENTHVSGSKHEKAKIELDIRRNRRLFESQKQLLSTLQQKLDKIAHILKYINKRPIVTILWAAAGTVAIGVLISIISACLLNLLNLTPAT